MIYCVSGMGGGGSMGGGGMSGGGGGGNFGSQNFTQDTVVSNTLACSGPLYSSTLQVFRDLLQEVFLKLCI